MEKKPFFARFLENQISKEAQKNLKGGDPPPRAVTKKFPADFAESSQGNHPCQQSGGNSNPNCP